MKRLLCIVGGMNAGGAETFLMKVYRALNREEYQMDFAVGEAGECFYDKEIEELGGKIYHITPKSAGVMKNFRAIRNLVKERGYEYVLRTSQHSLSALELLAAKKGGAKVRVFRSSNSSVVTGSKKHILLHKLFMFMPRRYANVRIAPSTEAAEFMFGKNCIKKNRASLIHNAIDVDRFAFDAEKREEIRRELGLDGRFVVGHIGRFNQQKNHKFLIRVFEEISKLQPNAVLLLVGKGELEEAVRRQAEECGLLDKVVFAGVRSDVPALLSSMDVFVFPSFYEGMPNTVIEAQANGLSCLISDKITPEAKITDLVEYMPLSAEAKDWAVAALAEKPARADQKEKFIAARYDMASVVEDFIEVVFQPNKA